MFLASASLTATLLVGCGASRHPTSVVSTATTTKKTTTTTTTASGPGALQAEANAAAAGDIPDNQVFLVFRNLRAGYSMKYPEGWAQRGRGRAVIFRDKNNIVRIDVRAGAAPTVATITHDLRRLKGAHLEAAPRSIQLPSGRAFKAVYAAVSAPNAVTGKRVTLVVDRYYLARGRRTAVVDLGTPRGVDNVDAYRLMIESFRWR